MKPIVVSTLRPPVDGRDRRTHHRGGTTPTARRRACDRAAPRCASVRVFVAQPVEAVPPQAVVEPSCGPPYARAASGIVAWNAVSKHATCGRSGSFARAARMPARPGPLWSGAKLGERLDLGDDAGVDRRPVRRTARRRGRSGARPRRRRRARRPRRRARAPSRRRPHPRCATRSTTSSSPTIASLVDVDPALTTRIDEQVSFEVFI